MSQHASVQRVVVAAASKLLAGDSAACARGRAWVFRACSTKLGPSSAGHPFSTDVPGRVSSQAGLTNYYMLDAAKSNSYKLVRRDEPRTIIRSNACRFDETMIGARGAGDDRLGRRQGSVAL